MARSIVWPQVAPPVEVEPPTPSHRFDLGGLGAIFGPELARRMGLRVTAGPDPAASAAAEPEVLLGSVPLAPAPDGLSAVHVGCTPGAGAMLLERLFGARGTDAGSASGAELLRLPPGSASWIALCRTVTGALAAAMAGYGRPVGGSPDLPLRAIPMPSGARLDLLLDVDGTACRLALILESEDVPQAERPKPDAMAFRRAARARAFELELPVALRVAEQRIPLSQALTLSVGDIVPIEPLPMPDVLAGGRRIARLPAASLARPAARSAPDDVEDKP